ncbi:MAG: S9 family peptidase [Gemmataceae bacterium]|nr:S9 family peptidase [Gemmataceae bacterium]
MDRVLLLSFAFLMLAAVPAVAADKKRAMKLDDLFKLKRVADPHLSPDGKWVAYSVATVDLEKNGSTSALWIAPAGEGEAKQLTTGDKKDGRPRWSPDGKRLLFQSNRSGSQQLWVIEVDGGEARQLTTISTGAEAGTWSRDGKTVAFVSAVFPEFSAKPFKEADEANKKKQEEIDKSPVKARTFTKLFYRHWDSYVEGKRHHLFVIPAKGGEPRGITSGDRDFIPNSSTFQSGEDFQFSPDGKWIVTTASPEKDEAWSTDFQLVRVPVAGGKPETLTSNKAADASPRFSPDGKKLAYRAQKKAGYEADKWDLMVVEVDEGGAFSGKPKSATGKLDISVDEFEWSGDARLVTTHAMKGSTAIALVSMDDEGGAGFAEGHNSGLSVSADGKTVAFVRSRLSHPGEVFVWAMPGKPREASHANKALLGKLDLPAPESVTVKGAGGTPMQMWILKPPGFDATKKYPVAYLVHGGPQGAWEDGWSFRWNPQLWAARGYVVALPNPRGSTGFGQKYVDEIAGDWGGKCYEDLMKGLDHVESLPYVDKARIGAAGASFGGYMMNWFAVNTGRFKCLISHCSVWNFDSMYGTTDELWFDEWEHGGPPWGKNRESYEKHSPQRLAGNLGKHKTPMLVIHNDLDFRCPIGQGHELFTALQRQKVPSRFVNFPDEGHWVLKPKNSEHWHKEVFAWLEKHVPPGGK